MRQKVGNKDYPIQYKDYRIIEWLIPDVVAKYAKIANKSGQEIKPEDYQAPFKSFDYILNEKAHGIRLSDEMNTFYQENYVKTQASRFKDFSGFSKYNFDWIFEVRDYDEKGTPKTQLLQGNNVCIPNFLSKIADDYGDLWNQEAKIITKSANFFNQKDLLRVVREAFSGFASYPSTVKSTIVSIELSLTNIGFKLVKEKYS